MSGIKRHAPNIRRDTRESVVPCLRYPSKVNVTMPCGTFLLGLWLGSPLYWLVGIALHFPMRIVTALDHNFFRLGRLWLETKGASVHSDLWGGSSFAVLPAGCPKTARELATSV